MGTITPRPPQPLWLPSDDGFLGANSDPATESGGGVLIGGTLYVMRLNRGAGPITNIHMGISSVGVGASNGSFVGAYSASGALLSGSADVGAVLAGTTGYKAIGALTTPQGFVPGMYLAILCNLVTTQVGMMRQANSSISVAQAVANPATLRWGQFPAVGTTLPTQLTMANMAATAFTVVVLWT